MYRAINRYKFKRKRRKKCPQEKNEWAWKGQINSRDIYIGLSFCSEQNNYEIREARMGGNSFIFHVGSPKDPIACLWRAIKKIHELGKDVVTNILACLERPGVWVFGDFFVGFFW